MGLTVTKLIEVPVSELLLRVPVDCILEEDDSPPNIPGIVGKWWEARIDLATGQIANWKRDEAIEVFGKVRDEGEYRLLDERGVIVVERTGCYVPACVNDGGDYIGITVEPDGKIRGWHPDLGGFGVEDSD